MKKILSFWSASFLMAFSLASHADAVASLGLQAKQFYVWYINKQENQVFPLLDHEIDHYVDASTVESLRRDYKRDQLPGGADYFLKVQDYDERDWLAHI
ncbi:hypothetical protein NLR13_25625, partial [Escherichia coli]|nr:hypothetical protein [Escherichia coli]